MSKFIVSFHSDVYFCLTKAISIISLLPNLENHLFVMAFPLLLIGIVEYTLLYVTLHIETCFPVYEVTFAKL
jgi:hypothetical protein